MKKVFDQTVRDIKREVNKKVLKVPGVEQKVLDATSNEPWGPHGSHLADIAQATRNYNEYQMIMSVIWKRINDTGKNWRHVYKALSVLEYLVANGSERVIDDIREHSYQISTLSDFQYIDSSGRDQGSNVRRKSQSLVTLVNDRERIQEVRQKAFANKDKYRGATSAGGLYRPSPYSSPGSCYGDRYEDDHYEAQYQDDRNGYGREKEWSSRDDDRLGRTGDHYGRDSDARYGRDAYRDDGYRGNRKSDEHGSRNRSYDRDRNHSYDEDDDDRDSSRHVRDKFSQEDIGAPPSYEEVISGVPGHIQSQRDGPPPSLKAPSASEASSPIPKASTPNQMLSSQASHDSSSPCRPDIAMDGAASSVRQDDAFDEFDPRASMTVSQPTADVDIFGTAGISTLALVPVTMDVTSDVDKTASSDFGSNFVPLSSVSTVLNQPSEDPFGETPFRALPVDDSVVGQCPTAPALENTFKNIEGSVWPRAAAARSVEAVLSTNLTDTYHSMVYVPPSVATGHLSPVAVLSSDQQLPPGQHTSDPLGDALPQVVPPDLSSSYAALGASVVFLGSASAPGATTPLSAVTQNTGSVASLSSPAPSPPAFGSDAHIGSHITSQPPSWQFGITASGHQALDTMDSCAPAATLAFIAPPPAKGSTGLYCTSQQPIEKFEPKSTVWADTLSRGLVNLNISGSKINPLADIGVDFDSLNRHEKRREKEKISSGSVTSTVTMGKAMGSGSGIGRVGASILTPSANPVTGAIIGVGMGSQIGMSGPGMGPNAGMGGFGGGKNQPVPRVSAGINMGVGHGAQMRPSGPSLPGGLNSMTSGNYGTQPPPYGGFRSI